MKTSPGLSKPWRLLAVFVLSLYLSIPLMFVMKERVWVIRGTSMLPTFQDHSRLVLVWNNNTPSRGDIVLVDILDPDGQAPVNLIKRVIGVPGDHIQIRQGDHLIILNGAPLVESYLPPGVVYDVARDVTLGRNEYYIMGDNRGESLDSRAFGPVTFFQIRHILNTYLNF